MQTLFQKVFYPFVPAGMQIARSCSIKNPRSASLYLVKDYYIDGQNTQLIFFEKMSTWGGKQGPQITSRGWIFWTMIFYNLKKFTSRSI